MVQVHMAPVPVVQGFISRPYLDISRPIPPNPQHPQHIRPAFYIHLSKYIKIYKNIIKYINIYQHISKYIKIHEIT